MFTLITRISLIALLIVLFAGCATKYDLARSYAQQEEWLKAVIELRKHQKDDPDSVEVKSLLRQTEVKAAEYYYQKGRELLLDNELDAALIQFQQGLIAMPDNDKIKQAIQDTMARKESYSLYTEAVRNYEIEDVSTAKQLLVKSLELYPTFNEAQVLLDKIVEQQKQDIDKNFILLSRNPITLSFKDTKLKTAFEFIVKAYGVNVIFDDELKEVPVNIYAQNVTFEQALSLMQRMTKTFYKIVGENTLLIASDTDEKRAQYEDYLIRVFNLKSIKAKVMNDILKGVLGLNNIILNEDMNTIIVRDTEERLKLAEDLVAINDRKPAEMILEVEILEVNRTKTELLGIDFGSQVSVAFPQFTGSFNRAISAGVITLPSVVVNYFKSEVDAKTLANPKVRVVDNKSAKIHIGDRVPLRSSTIQDATGQTRTTYEYRDIGIKLQVEPDIQVDDSIDVKLSLEVSSLGANLGAKEDPAYSIGTRNAETNMILKDGETAILGGLIRDEERKNHVKIPGLGDIPVVGTLFTQYDEQDTRTDVLLTITPRIVRSWDTATEIKRTFYSGTKKGYSTKPIFGSLERVASDTPASPQLARNIALNKSLAQKMSPKASLGFDDSVYSVLEDGTFQVAVNFTGEQGIKFLSMPMLYNPDLVEYLDYSVPSDVDGHVAVRHDKDSGELDLTFNDIPQLNKDDNNRIITLTLRAKRKGVSYLMHKASGYITESGAQKRVQNSASKIIIK